jgi:predicted DNA-binding transcriptional regulator YafY
MSTEVNMEKVSTKTRLLEVMRILKNETDEENPLSIAEIIFKLENAFNIKSGGEICFEKKAIKDDIDALIDSGASIDFVTGEKGKKSYYMTGNPFGIFELRILIDAVTSAKFLTNEDTKILIKKIKSLTSESLRPKLQNTIHVDEMVKSDSKDLKDHINTLHSAILNNNKVAFRYGNYNVRKEFVLHRSGEYYCVVPYSVVWNNDFYYLVCFDENKDSYINYRIDRMREVMETEEKSRKDDFKIAVYLSKCFNMYPGQEDVVKIQFRNGLINAVIDKLGKNVTVWKVDDEFFQARFHAAINEGLLRWVLMWGEDAKDIEPSELIDMVKSQGDGLKRAYK